MASALQAEGHEFNPRNFHPFNAFWPWLCLMSLPVVLGQPAALFCGPHGPHMGHPWQLPFWALKAATASSRLSPWLPPRAMDTVRWSNRALEAAHVTSQVGAWPRRLRSRWGAVGRVPA